MSLHLKNQILNSDKYYPKVDQLKAVINKKASEGNKTIKVNQKFSNIWVHATL